MKQWREYTRWARAVTLAGVLGAGLLVAVPSASAHDFDDRGRCEEQVERQEARLNRAIWRYGFYSRQADRERHELAEMRERCFRHNRFRREYRRHGDGDWDRDDYR